MFLRDIRYPLRLLSHELVKNQIVTFIHINTITKITINKCELAIDTSDRFYRYKYQNEQEAEKMGERVLNYIQACKRNISKDTYLNITGHYCPDVKEIVNNQIVPRNYISYKDYKKQEEKKKQTHYQQRLDQPGPDIDALMILQEHEKSLTVVKDTQLK